MSNTRPFKAKLENKVSSNCSTSCTHPLRYSWQQFGDSYPVIYDKRKVVTMLVSYLNFHSLQNRNTLPEHLSSSRFCCGVHVTRSFVLCVCFVDRCLSLCPFSFGICVVCSSSIYGFWLPLWYLWYAKSNAVLNII